jgi:DNA-3-methyladenine glycosylase II
MNDANRRRPSRAGKAKRASLDRWAAAVKHLRRVDPHLKAIIDRIGPCQLEPHPDRFAALVRSIVGQQISTTAARSINQKLVTLAGDPPRPERLIELGEAQLRTVGLSSAKARYVLNLAEAVAGGELPLDEFDDTWDDQTIIESLIAVKGIGVWTAEMFLIFVMNRPDVFPAGDLGVRAALRERHGMAELPAPRDCHPLAEAWRPYRTIASWYIWRRIDTARPAAAKHEIPNPKSQAVVESSRDAKILNVSRTEKPGSTTGPESVKRASRRTKAGR